jgi:hypothetical protein
MVSNTPVIYQSYNPEHYSPYAGNCGVNRPVLLDQFLNDSRTCRLPSEHTTKLHIAIIVKRGKIIAEATNKVASRSNGAASRGSQNYIHAEKNVLRVLGDVNKLRGADMYVMRLGKVCREAKDVEFKYSQPCPECTVLLQKCMREYGLRHVYFTK